MILRSRHFFAQAVARQRIKGPVEFAAGLARMLELPPAGLNLLALAAACDRQGQELFAPPNVKGWDGGTTWLNSATLLERAQLVQRHRLGQPGPWPCAVRSAGLGGSARHRSRRRLSTRSWICWSRATWRRSASP